MKKNVKKQQYDESLIATGGLIGLGALICFSAGTIGLSGLIGASVGAFCVLKLTAAVAKASK